jgi:hypothetical protein
VFWACIPRIQKDPWGRQPGAETSRILILVINCIFLSASDGRCINWYSCVSDPMVDSWFLMSSPVPVLTILGSYLYFVLKLGPQLMATRRAFNLQKILVTYNFYQVLFSLWLCTLVSAMHRLLRIIISSITRQEMKNTAFSMLSIYVTKIRVVSTKWADFYVIIYINYHVFWSIWLPLS